MCSPAPNPSGVNRLTLRHPTRAVMIVLVLPSLFRATPSRLARMLKEAAQPELTGTKTTTANYGAARCMSSSAPGRPIGVNRPISKHPTPMRMIISALQLPFRAALLPLVRQMKKAVRPASTGTRAITVRFTVVRCMFSPAPVPPGVKRLTSRHPTRIILIPSVIRLPFRAALSRWVR